MAKRLSQRGRRSPWLRLGLFSGALVLFLLGYYAGNRYQRQDLGNIQGAVLLRPPLDIPEFRALDVGGNALDSDRLRDRWSLLLAGPLQHPSTAQGLSQLSRIYNRLAQYPDLQKDLQLIVLTPDDGSLSTRELRDRVRAYNPRMIAAAGDTQALQPLWETLGLPSTEDATAALHLINPAVQVYAMFTGTQDPATIAHDIQLITNISAQ